MDNEARRALLRQLRNTPIEPLDAGFPHTVNIPSATYAPWLIDTEFTRIYEAARHQTLVDIYRCYELWTLARRQRHVLGDILEVGTWRGGTGTILAGACALYCGDKTVFLCDTFKGVVKAGNKDTSYKGGEHSDASAEHVTALLAGLGLDNARILSGIFPDESGGKIADRLFSLCHIDVDVYASALDTFEWMAPRLSVHGIIVFDDYGFLGCEGVTRLVHEVARDERYFTFFNLNGHAVMLKLKD